MSSDVLQHFDLRAAAHLSPYHHGDLAGESAEAMKFLDPSAFPWDGPDEERTARGFECVKRSGTRRVLRFTAVGPAGASVLVYAKRCSARHWIKRLGSLFQLSKSHREWNLGWALLARGVPTAMPLLWAERRQLGMVAESYLLTLGIERSTSFFDVWRGLTTPDMRAEWLERLARFVRESHDKGFAHDDLSAEHVLVVAEHAASVSLPRFHFIDLDHGRLAKRVTAYRRAHNFFQIFRSLPSQTLGPEERRVFLLAYSDGKWTDRDMDRIERAVRMIRGLKDLRKAFPVLHARRRDK